MSTSGASVTFDAPNSGADVPSRASDGLIDSLAATYAAAMAALADKQRARREAAAEVIAIQSVQTPESRGIPSAPAISIAPTPSTAFGAPMHATWPNDGTQGAASETPKTLVRSPATPAIRPTTSAADALAQTIELAAETDVTLDFTMDPAPEEDGSYGIAGWSIEVRIARKIGWRRGGD
jgi:hypothetical protein